MPFDDRPPDEQSALLLFDAVLLDLTAGHPQAYAGMQAHHANLE
jgi:hypothetical protein